MKDNIVEILFRLNMISSRRKKLRQNRNIFITISFIKSDR